MYVASELFMSSLILPKAKRPFLSCCNNMDKQREITEMMMYSFFLE